MCLHSIILDPKNPKRMFIAISAAGAFRTDDGGKTWKPINHGLHSEYIPDPNAEVGHCVHHIAMHPSRPNTLFMQKHWDIMRSDDAGDSWREVSGNLPSDFGFPIDIHAHEPETIYVVPIKSDSQHFPPDGKLRVYRSRTGGNEWEELTKGLPQRDCYVNVLRDAMTVDSLDSCGVYFGTTGGQVYGSNDAGDSVERDRARSSGRSLGRSADAAMIRVVLPHHLRTLARVGDEVQLEVNGRDTANQFSTRSRQNIRCCAERSAITKRKSADRSSGFLLAAKMCRMSRRTLRCPTRSRKARSRSLSWVRLQAAETSQKEELRIMKEVETFGSISLIPYFFSYFL